MFPKRCRFGYVTRRSKPELDRRRWTGLRDDALECRARRGPKFIF